MLTMILKRKKLAVFLLFVFLCAIWIVINSRDLAAYDSLGFSTEMPQIPDSENGFVLLLYTQDETSELNLADDVDVLKSHINGSEWDVDFVDRVLASHESDLINVEKAIEFAKFQIPSSKNVNELPDYTTIYNLFRILILKAMHEEKQGNTEAAIKLANTALLYSQRLKMEENEYLLSYMVGLAMQHEAVLRIHHLSNNENLSDSQLLELQTLLSKLSSYREDGFDRVFEGEYAFVSSFFDSYLNLSFPERLKQYRDDEDWSVGGGNSEWISEDKKTVSRQVFRVLAMLFPKYYMHRNRTLEASAPLYKAQQVLAQEFCNEISGEIEEVDWTVDITWKDIVQPNSLGMKGSDDFPIFDEYFIRRCFAFSYTQAVEAIIGLQRYKRDHAVFPDSLSALLPDYLEKLPIDPFTGNSLHYSPTTTWLYGFGTNKEDDGGSFDSMYYARCAWDEKCTSNPTFPVDAALLKTEI